MEFVEMVMERYAGGRITAVFKKTLILILTLKQLMFLLLQPAMDNPKEIATQSSGNHQEVYVLTDWSRVSLKDTPVIEFLQSLTKINIPESALLRQTSPL